MTVDSGASVSDKDEPPEGTSAPSADATSPEPRPPDAPAPDAPAPDSTPEDAPAAAARLDAATAAVDPAQVYPAPQDDPAPRNHQRDAASQDGSVEAGRSDRGSGADDAPIPGAKPGGAKRRRTASMKISRPAPEVADGADEDSEFGPPHRILDSTWAVRVEEFLDSPAGTATLLGTAAVTLLLGPLAIYSLFAVVFIFRRSLRARVARLPLGPRTTLGVLIVLAGLSRELFTWITEYVQGDDQTALLHPQLVPHLLITLGIYTAWAVGWGVSLWWYNYRLGEALIIQAVSGLVLENFGQTLLAGLSTMPQGIVLWLYAMVVSASTLGVAWLLATDKLDTLRERDLDGTLRYAAPALLTGAALVLIFAFWLRLLNGLHAIPAQAPIRERPFW